MYGEPMGSAGEGGNDWLVPKIRVIGLGGGGCNAVDRMITVGIPGVEYIAANTDAQSLSIASAPTRIQLGPQLTRGLGAGGSAEVGRKAAEESEQELREALEGADMVFLAAGMGGGTGTGSVPVVARIARELGALTVAVVTCPFAFEGAQRARTAQAGLQRLERHVHTLVRVQNDLLLEVAPKDLRLEVAFCVADEVLRQGIQGITELVTQAGLINLDFASVAAVIRQGGNALMAIGRGDTVQQAAEAALGHPLLENALIDRASALLVHVTGDSEMGLADIDEAMSKIIQRAHPAVDLLFGASEDQEIGGRAQVILIATGIRESRREPIAVQSLFGVPLPATEKDDIPEEPEPADVWESLDVPAFMRRPELSGLGTHTRE